MIRAIIGVVALLLIVGGIVGGVYYWNKIKGPEEVPTVAEGPEVALGDEALDVSDAEIPGEIVPGGDEAPVPGDDVEEVVIPIGEEEAPVDLSGEDIVLAPEDTEGTGRALAPEGGREETRPLGEIPADEGSSDITAIEPMPEPTAAPEPTAVPETPSGPSTEAVEPAPAPTATPIPTTPVETPAPAPTVAAGNYQVYTIAPVSATKLKEIEGAMKPLRVTLRKQEIGAQQRQAYRVALGYYRTKQEADGWARQYLKPRSIQYYVYPAQGMYSIQLGVYAERANVDRKLRELYQQFQGWRLPLRTEVTMLNTKAYQLSVRGITESLAKQVQNTLFRLRVPAELAGI
jgi:hypothetical protein